MTGRNRWTDGGAADDIFCEMESSDGNCRRYGRWRSEDFRETAWASVEKNGLDDAGASVVFSFRDTDGNILAALFYNFDFEPFFGKADAEN